MTDEELDAIEKRADKAPQGPWRTYPNPMRDDGVFVGQDRPATFYPQLGLDGQRLPHAVPDGAWSVRSQVEPSAGEFIAHSRQDVPALVAEVRRLRAANAALWKASDLQTVLIPKDPGHADAAAILTRVVDYELKRTPEGGQR